MAWGRGAASQGLDDLCTRLKANDPRLASLTILKHRKFDHGEVLKLCASLASNSILSELYASNHPMSSVSAAAVGEMLLLNSTLTSLCIGKEGTQTCRQSCNRVHATPSETRRHCRMGPTLTACMHAACR